MNEIKSLIADVKSAYWRKRIENSIQNILRLYKLKEGDIEISRTRIEPKDIWVASLEQCNLKEAKQLIRGKYSKKLPSPITIIQYKGKNVIFIGSNRSIVFVLKKQIPDCVVVKLPDTMKEPTMISEAKVSLQETLNS